MKLRKGMEFSNKSTGHILIYGKKCEDGRLWCIEKKTKRFIKLTLEELTEQYISISERNKLNKEKRSRQSW
ncbi:hypothetical protein DID78_04350 [Candidatus Marinamargulisbacteria bacterium SCGC AG-343-D04]|nr:hypothetical protein DID78_04350 [Candidatus Marinamargulisbacteria bacterium SCGC AG-343-D04]